MIVAMGNEMGYTMDDPKYHHMEYKYTGWLSKHDWQPINNYVLHCRTSFSNHHYTQYGYMYNTHPQDGKKSRCFGKDQQELI